MNKGINTKLFKQWAKEAELPPTAIQPDLEDRRPKRMAAPTSYHAEMEDRPRDIQSGAMKKGMIQIPVRYVFLMLTTIAALLVTLSVLITIQLS